MQHIRISSVATIILTLCAAMTAAHAQRPANYFPLDEGTFWAYDANVEYSVREAPAPAPLSVRKKNLRYEIRVLDHLSGDGIEAGLLDGYPSDLSWYEEGQQRSKCIILRTGTNNYFLLTRDVDKIWKELQTGGFDGNQEELNGSSLILQAPLEAGMRFGEFEQTARTRYCWVVEGARTVESIPGVPASAATAYSLAFRTSPDHTFIEFLPGVGIVHYEYSHHGTVANASLSLVQFSAAQAKP